MRISGILVAVSCFLFISEPFMAAQSTAPQKVAEGQYVRVRDGKAVEGSTQTWTLTRSSDGKFVLHDEFLIPPDATIQLLAGLAASGGAKRMSQELLDKLAEAITLTGMDVTLSADKKAESLKVNGKRVSDGKSTQALNCSIADRETKCKGTLSSAKSKHNDRQELLYGFPFPMLMMPFLTHPPGAGESHDFKVDLLPENVQKPALRTCDAELTFVDQEPFKAGDQTYSVNRYKLQVCPTDTPAGFVVWSLPGGLIMGMQTSMNPGETIQLVQLKMYSEM